MFRARGLEPEPIPALVTTDGAAEAVKATQSSFVIPFENFQTLFEELESKMCGSKKLLSFSNRQLEGRQELIFGL